MKKLSPSARFGSLLVLSASLVGLSGCNWFDRTFDGTSDEIATATNKAEYHHTAAQIGDVLSVHTEQSLAQPFNVEVYNFCKSLERPDTQSSVSDSAVEEGCDKFFSSRKVKSVHDVKENFETVDSAVQRNTDRLVASERGQNNFSYRILARDLVEQRDESYSQLLHSLREIVVKTGTQAQEKTAIVSTP